MVISPTPAAFSNFCLICLSAIRVTSRRERRAETAICKMGAASGSNFCTTGCLAVCGNCGTIRLTLFCTSCAATSVMDRDRGTLADGAQKTGEGQEFEGELRPQTGTKFGRD